MKIDRIVMTDISQMEPFKSTTTFGDRVVDIKVSLTGESTDHDAAASSTPSATDGVSETPDGASATDAEDNSSTPSAPFKVGDRVRAVRTGAVLERGDEYVVVDVVPGVFNHPCLVIEIAGTRYRKDAKLFELVEDEAPKFKVGDRVRIKETPFHKINAGKVGTIYGVSDNGEFDIDLDDEFYNVARKADDLELAEDRYAVGDIVRVNGMSLREVVDVANDGVVVATPSYNGDTKSRTYYAFDKVEPVK